MMLTTLPWEAFSSGQNNRVSRTQPKNFRTLEPHGIGQIDECPRARRARIVDQYVATLEAFVDPLEQLLAGRERAQIAGDGEGLRSLRGNRLGGDREIFRR
jgi:hypothetical protein